MELRANVSAPRPRRGVRDLARLAHDAVSGPGRARARGHRRPRRGGARLLPRRVDRLGRGVPHGDGAAVDRRRPVRARGDRLAARGRGRGGRGQGGRRRGAARLDRQAARRTGVAPPRALAGGLAHVLHDRHRQRRGDARPGAAGACLPRAQGQARRARGPGAARGRTSRVPGEAAARGRERGLDARGGKRADAGAGGARGGARRAALPRRRPRLVPRPARARAATARDRRRGLPRPERRRSRGRLRRGHQRQARQVGWDSRGDRA